MACYEARQSKLFRLQMKEKELVRGQVEEKKKMVKKHADMVSLAQGQEIESDDPFRIFIKQLAQDREKRRKEEQ